MPWNNKIVGIETNTFASYLTANQEGGKIQILATK